MKLYHTKMNIREFTKYLPVLSLIALIYSCAAAPPVYEVIAPAADPIIAANPGTVAVDSASMVDPSGNIEELVSEDIEDFIIEVPPGVDTLIAVIAESLANQLFVNLEEERRAKEIFDSSLTMTEPYKKMVELFKKERDSTRVWTSDDTTKFLLNMQTAKEAMDKANYPTVSRFQGRRYIELTEDERAVFNEKARRKMIKHFENARDNILTAVDTNPFDFDLKNGLVSILQSLAVLKQDANDLEEAQRILEALSEWMPDSYYITSMMADNYAALKDMPSALKYYQISEDLIWETVTLSMDDENSSSGSAYRCLDDNSIDWLLSFIEQQVLIEINQMNSTSALNDLNRLIALSDEEAQQNLLTYRKDLLWDNGNLWTYNEKKKMYSLHAEKDWDGAYKTAEKILPAVSNNKARNEVVYLMSVLDYQYFDQREKALENIKKLVDDNKKYEGAPPDSVTEDYFESYGTMCFNMGCNYREEDRKKAMKYFLQATTFNWSGKYRCYLFLSELSRNDPKKVIEYCEEMNKYAEDLSINDRISGLKMMYDAYRRMRKFVLARECMNKWKELHEYNNVGS